MYLHSKGFTLFDFLRQEGKLDHRPSDCEYLSRTDGKGTHGSNAATVLLPR